MNYLEAKNPVWASIEHDAITLNVTFEKLGEVPFAATPNDTEPHGRELFDRAVAGDFGPIAEYVAPPVPEPYVPVEVEGWQAEVAIRTQRNVLLQQSDFSQLPDSPVDPIAWAIYRQALRDITEQTGFPEVVDWPTKPE